MNDQTSESNLTTPSVEDVQEPLPKRIGRPPGPQKPCEPLRNPIITEDAFKVSHATVLAAYDKDRRIGQLRKELVRQQAIFKNGKAKLLVKKLDYCKERMKFINRVQAQISKRKKQIRKNERVKLIQKAAKEFAKRAIREGLTI